MKQREVDARAVSTRAAFAIAPPPEVGWLGLVDSARACIEHYGLKPIPEEGGWFRRVLESTLKEDGRQAAWTSILALFTRDGFSALHRLSIDEVWVYHEGDALEMLLLRPVGDGAGDVATIRLGLNAETGERPRVAVPAGTWQGARPVGDRGWGLVSCLCVPGFLPECFELGRRDVLMEMYQESRNAIAEFTRG